MSRLRNCVHLIGSPILLRKTQYNGTSTEYGVPQVPKFHFCRALRVEVLMTRFQASLFSCFILFSVVQPKLRSEKLPKLTVTWHFSLVQPRVKNARTLTVKGMMKNWWNLYSEVTNYSP